MRTQIFFGLTGLFASLIFLIITINQFAREVDLTDDESNGEIKQAKKELILAEQDFNLAEPDYAEIAVLKLRAAQMKYSKLIQEKRVV